METKTIDITPKWEALVPLFASWIREGTESQREYVIEELTKLAKAVDASNESKED